MVDANSIMELTLVSFSNLTNTVEAATKWISENLLFYFHINLHVQLGQ